MSIKDKTDRELEIAVEISCKWQDDGELRDLIKESLSSRYQDGFRAGVEQATKIVRKSPCGCNECLTCAWHFDLAKVIQQELDGGVR